MCEEFRKPDRKTFTVRSGRATLVHATSESFRERVSSVTAQHDNVDKVRPGNY